TIVFTLAGSTPAPQAHAEIRPTAGPSGSTSPQAQTSPVADVKRGRVAPSTSPPETTAAATGAMQTPPRAPSGAQAASPAEMERDTATNGSRGSANPVARSSPEVAVSES